MKLPFLLLLLLPLATPLPSGAPTTVCSTLTPFHGGGIPTQTSPSPYAVFPSTTQLAEGQPLRVSLGSKQGLTYQGFMLQARTSLARDVIGTFRAIPDGSKGLKCKEGNDTTTHSNTQGKGLVEFEWLPPAGYRGDVIFNATVAQNYGTFWTGIESPVIRIVRSSEISRTTAFYSGCGITHQCFGAPRGCEATQNCKSMVKVQPEDGNYIFEMMGAPNGMYVAAGLSDDQIMRDDSVMECVKENGEVKAYMSMTHGKTAPKRLSNPQEGIQLVDWNIDNGQIYCKISRKARTTVENRVFDIDKEQYHLMIVAGKEVKPSNVGFHDIIYSASPEKRMLSNPKVTAGTTPPNFTPTTELPVPESSHPLYDDCGVSKGCFGAPDGCISTRNCRVITAILVQGERYVFELLAPRDAMYAAVGLSEDPTMGDDSVIECVNEGNKGVQAYMSVTTPRPNLGAQRLTNAKQGIQLLQGKAADGSIYCQVERDARTKVNDKWYDLVNNPYILLVATGSNVKANGVEYHSIALAAGEKRFLSNVSAIGGASKLLIRLHGAFMLIAWVGTASAGILLARYYRQTWVGSQICGKDLWFAWHRFFMVCTWGLTTVAFILIFVELKAWSVEKNPHAILGVITTIICFLQPIGAFFRPHPGTPQRPVFNWLHWLGGNVAHILGIVTIFFAVKLAKAELPEWMDWILVAYVAFHVLIHILLSFMSWLQILGCIADRTSESRVTAFPMKDLGVNGRSAHSFERSQDAPKSGVRKVILFLYLLFLICFVVTMVVIIVMAPIEESWAQLRKKMSES